MKKPIIPFFLFASIAVLLVGSTLSAQDNQPNKGVGFKTRLIDFNEVQKSDDKFLKIENWDVELNSSSAYISNVRRSYAKEAVNKSNNRSFLGIRGNFPSIEANSYITVKPRYQISFYDKNAAPIAQPNLKGVIPNVGTLREARVRVGGRNYKHRFLVKMIKNTGEMFNLDFGSLAFNGWKELVWKNPYFLDDYRHEKGQLTPLYPRIVSGLKFDSIIVFRNRLDANPGDFITYVDYIDVSYDKAFLYDDTEENPDDTIDDEGTWGIIKNEIAGPKSVLLQQRQLAFQCLERMEKLKRNVPLTEEEKNFNPCYNNEGSQESKPSDDNMNAENVIAPILDEQPAE